MEFVTFLKKSKRAVISVTAAAVALSAFAGLFVFTNASAKNPEANRADAASLMNEYFEVKESEQNGVKFELTNDTLMDTAYIGPKGSSIGKDVVCSAEGGAFAYMAQSEQSGEVFYLPYGCVITLIANDGNWCDIQSGDLRGFVKTDALSFGSDAAALEDTTYKEAVRTTADEAYLYESAAEDSDIICVLYAGVDYETYSDGAQYDGEAWLEVKAGDLTGFAKTADVTVTKERVTALALDYEDEYKEAVEKGTAAAAEIREEIAAKKEAERIAKEEAEKAEAEAKVKAEAEAKAAEEAKAASQSSSASSGNSAAATASSASSSGDWYNWLLQATMAENGGDYYAAYLTASTILNRAGGNPDAVIGVISAPNQFEVYSTGRMWQVSVSDTCRAAVDAAIAGRDTNVYYFCSSYCDFSSWATFYCYAGAGEKFYTR